MQAVALPSVPDGEKQQNGDENKDGVEHDHSQDAPRARPRVLEEIELSRRPFANAPFENEPVPRVIGRDTQFAQGPGGRWRDRTARSKRVYHPIPRGELGLGKDGQQEIVNGHVDSKCSAMHVTA